MEITFLDSSGKILEYLTQWDINRKLKIDGFKLQTPPMIHFYNNNSLRALVVPSTLENNSIIVNIPNLILQKDEKINVAIFLTNEVNEGKTVYIGQIPVITKIKPEDYNYVENIDYANWVELSEEAKRKLLEMQGIIEDVETKLANGDFNGNGIDRIEKTKTEGLTDTYTIYYTNGTTYEYFVTNGSGGGGATGNYKDLTNKPKINNVELLGNKTLSDLGIKQIYTANDIKFTDGETFQQKYNNGELKGEQGEQGNPGTNGTNGITPTIGDNGNWYLGTEDTNKPSRGIQGEPGQAGANGQNGESGIPKEVAMTELVATIEPNKYYKWGEVASLDITLGTPVSNYLNEYLFEFKSGATPTTLTLPETIKWATNNTIDSNKTYQVSIVNNIGVIAGV